MNQAGFRTKTTCPKGTSQEVLLKGPVRQEQGSSSSAPSWD